MKFTKIIFATALAFATIQARAEGVRSDDGATIDQALQVELTGDGLSLIAHMVKDQLPGEMNDMALPDVEKDLPGGFKVRASGIKASLALDSLALAPSIDTLNIKVGVKKIKIAINQIDIERPVLGFPLGATCRYTTFNVAEQGIVYLGMGLQPTIVDTNIQLAAGKVDFPVSADNYRVQGPGECRGTLVLDGVVQQLLHGVFGMVRPLLGNLVASKVKEFLPQIADELNAQTHLSVQVDLNGLPSLPDRTAELSAFPSRLKIDGNALTAEVGVKIRQVTRQRDFTEALPLLGTQSKRFGAIGINPGILTAAFGELYQDGTDFFDVDENTIPQIKDLLTKDGLSAIWPYLLQAQTDAPYLKLAIRLAETPVFVADQDLQAITVHLPKVQLKFQIQSEGAWKDYFIMDLNLKTGAAMKIEDGNVKIGLIEHSEVAVEGRWADGYTPADSTFEKDTAQAVFAALLEIAYGQGPLVNMPIPSIPIGGQEIYLGHPHVAAPYFRIDLTGN